MKTKNQEFLAAFNKAFAENNTEYILNNVSKNIKWEMAGDFTANGFDEFSKYLKNMESVEPWEIQINKIITHGQDASVNGIIRSNDGKEYAFCDVYRLTGFKNPKVSEMTSYVIDIT